MARATFDAVIEAVHFGTRGRIAAVRVYQRRGAAFSDRFLLERSALVEELKRGRRFVTGQRKPFLGSVFEAGPQVVYHAGDRDVVATSDQDGDKDSLSGALLF
ncbi:MAG: hypothetical protein FJZ96_10645 [Chloroflexi bacterium]|nr:hypothetical protein [Chloroflexota bacterium]